jgi:hypothetical protein
MNIAAGRKYVARDKTVILILSAHPLWPDMVIGRPEDGMHARYWTWNLEGDYLHRNGEPHKWDLLGDVGMGIMFPKPPPKKE